MIKRKVILWISFLVAIFLIFIVVFSHVQFKAFVTIGGKTFSTEVADTKKLLEKGLSGHEPLGTSEGMLFVFKKPNTTGFWMKDMLFPIDIIWIDENLKVVHIEKSLSPSTYPTIYYPSSPALYTLELKAGQVEDLQIKIGDSVQIKKKWL